MNPILFAENHTRPSETLNPQISQHCEDFARKRLEYDGSFYVNYRGGAMPSLVSNWGYKCSEFAASQYLTKAFGLPVVLPDMKIYKRTQKSFDEDLLYNNVNFLGKDYAELKVHVKSTQEGNSSHEIPESYVLQLMNAKGTGGTDPLLKSTSTNHVVVLVCYSHLNIDHDNAKFHIRGVLPWLYCKSLLENPQKEYLVGKKICLYTHTLLKHLPKA